MTLDLTRPLCTRDGRKVLLLGRAPEPCDAYPIAVALQGRDGEWQIETYRADGTFFREGTHRNWDLVNAPVSVTAAQIRELRHDPR